VLKASRALKPALRWDKLKYHYHRVPDFLALLREKLGKGWQMKLEEADTHLA
jgi:hypothetical protein